MTTTCGAYVLSVMAISTVTGLPAVAPVGGRGGELEVEDGVAQIGRRLVVLFQNDDPTRHAVGAGGRGKHKQDHHSAGRRIASPKKTVASEAWSLL